MRLRTSLLILAVATAAPLVGVALFAVGYVFERENDTVINASIARNRAVLEAVDSQLRATIGTLNSLAASKSIARGDFAAFHREANDSLATQPLWQDIVLLDTDGRQLVDTRLPWGSALLPQAADANSHQAVVATNRPAVGNLTFAPRLQDEPGIRVRVPVNRDGKLAFVLSAVVKPAAFQQILENQKLPEGWVSGLVGTDGRIFARVPAVPLGTMASPDYRARIGAAAEGWYRGKTVEGRDTFTAFSRSALTGWTIGYAIPSEQILGEPLRGAGLLAGGVALSMLFALLIGYWLSRRIARPVAELAEAAPLLQHGTPPPQPVSAISEVSALARALGEAASAIRNRDAELAAQADELRKVDEHKTRFLAQISHELRGPLTPLRNASQLLALTNDPRVQDDAKAVIRRQLALLTRLVNDFVDIGRIGRGQLDLQLALLSLERVANESVEMVKPQMDAKQQVLVVRHSPAALVVNGDADRLVQVLSNLLTNASRYSPEGSVIELALARVGDSAAFSVIDKGMGFTPADAARIFDMFVRLAQPGEGVQGSLGIGLAVTRAIVDLHGGRIEAHSDGLGKGATFTVTLPMATAAQLAPAPPLAPAASAE